MKKRREINAQNITSKKRTLWKSTHRLKKTKQKKIQKASIKEISDTFKEHNLQPMGKPSTAHSSHHVDSNRISLESSGNIRSCMPKVESAANFVECTLERFKGTSKHQLQPKNS